jgi:hypothetical protein
MIVACLAALVLFNERPVSPGQGTTASSRAKVETCEDTSRQLFGELPIRPTGPIKPPKQTHKVKPAYPEVPAGTVGSGMWIADVIIAPDGRVRKLSVLHDLTFRPPFPEFSKAISDAVLQWRYTPTVVDGRAVPVCMTISVDIHWR